MTNLRPHCTAQAMWAYLKRVYHQDNDAHHFQIKNAIVMFQHENRSIQDNYSVFLTFWDEYSDMVTTDVPIAILLII